MKLISRTFIVSLMTLLSVWSIPLHAEDIPSISVQFEKTPLFSEANFLPGDTITRFVKVTNSGNTSEPIQVYTKNKSESGGLGDVIYLKIKEGATLLWNGTLNDFFSAGNIILSTINPSEMIQYNFEAVFNPESGNSYQNATAGFDLVIGFEGGSVSDNEGGSGGDGGGSGGQGGDNDSSLPPQNSGGGGGGGGGTELTQLIIINQSVGGTNTNSGTASINWTTNLISTSQIVYGPAGVLYSLNLNAPNFGYPSGTIQDNGLVINHGQTLSGLALGTYRFRVISRLSPNSLPTIGNEEQFTLGVSNTNPPNTFVAPEIFSQIFNPESQQGGNEEGNTETEEESVGNSNNGTGGNSLTANAFNASLPRPDKSNLAAAFFGIPDWLLGNLDCISHALIWIIVLYILWALWSRRYKNTIPPLTPSELLRQKVAFLSVGSALVVILALMFTWCLLWPFVVCTSLFILGTARRIW